jgi:hypothetical protein
VPTAKIRESFWDVPLFRNASTPRNYSPRTLGDEAVLKTKAKMEQHHHQTATPRLAFSFNTLLYTRFSFRSVTVLLRVALVPSEKKLQAVYVYDTVQTMLH